MHRATLCAVAAVALVARARAQMEKGVFNDCDMQATNVSLLDSCANKTQACIEKFTDNIALRLVANPKGQCHCTGLYLACLTEAKWGCQPVPRDEEDQIKNPQELIYNRAVDACLSVPCAVEDCRQSGLDSLGNIVLGMKRITYPIFIGIGMLGMIALGVLSSKGTLPAAPIMLATTLVHFLAAALFLFRSTSMIRTSLYMVFWAAINAHTALAGDSPASLAFFGTLASIVNFGAYLSSSPLGFSSFGITHILNSPFSGCSTAFTDDRCHEFQLVLVFAALTALVFQGWVTIAWWSLWRQSSP